MIAVDGRALAPSASQPSASQLEALRRARAAPPKAATSREERVTINTKDYVASSCVDVSMSQRSIDDERAARAGAIRKIRDARFPVDAVVTLVQLTLLLIAVRRARLTLVGAAAYVVVLVEAIGVVLTDVLAGEFVGDWICCAAANAEQRKSEPDSGRKFRHVGDTAARVPAPSARRRPKTPRKWQKMRAHEGRVPGHK